ncbi:CDGSH iron-sulfur domain-containing protein [Actinokineospora terrae]|uniref:Iron-binding zinc finger CDGSH type n=1 Tax=Actinokineospora terrae TaxID=155974 RepID=A0A1H9WEY6_9PSEU|nr:CDGSH iron-sulfur domain-containing protein [Actinokineospora terrae]SES32496.1 Iron-binding zinc finger CDGSH type [Actinokineospora terrae]
MTARDTTVRITSGPVLVDGPVVVHGVDGSVVRSERFVTAVCTCRRSKIYPLCDASHREVRRATGSCAPADRDAGAE